MFSLTKKLALWTAAIMIVVGLVVPHVCLADVMPISGDHAVMVKADVHQHTTKTSKADHCCVSHHCCAGKVVTQGAVIWSVSSVSKAFLGYPISENVMGYISQGLERPPKAIL